MARVQYWLFATATVLMLAPVVGCFDSHPGIVPVSGVVTIDGEPVSNGQVTVVPQGHRAAVGRIGSDGRFTLSCFRLNDGAPVGVHPASVTAVEQVSENAVRWFAPQKYANQISSGLYVQIDGPTEDLKIELTWDGSKRKGPFVDRN